MRQSSFGLGFVALAMTLGLGITLTGCGKKSTPIALNFSAVAGEPAGVWDRIGTGGGKVRLTIEKQRYEAEIRGHRHHYVTTAEPILGRSVIGVWMGLDKRGRQVVEWLYVFTSEGTEYRKTVVERVVRTEGNSLILMDDTMDVETGRLKRVIGK